MAPRSFGSSCSLINEKGSIAIYGPHVQPVSKITWRKTSLLSFDHVIHQYLSSVSMKSVYFDFCLLDSCESFNTAIETGAKVNLTQPMTLKHTLETIARKRNTFIMTADTTGKCKDAAF